MRKNIAPADLRELLRYDPESGHLFWRARDPSRFADTERRSAARNAAWWNGRFAGKRACKSDGHRGYLRVCLFGDEYPAHRVIWAMETGAWPVNSLDHTDGDMAHNQMANLREATVSENNRNRRAHGKSQFRGVSWRSRQSCWVSAIKTDGKVTFLGCFDNEETAARAYDEAAVVQHGRFARINFPQDEQRVRSALSAAPVREFGTEPRGCPTPGACSCPAAASAAQEPGWQDISTAPKDRYVLIWCDGVYVARYDSENDLWYFPEDGCAVDPTHWRPLPPPPSAPPVRDGTAGAGETAK